MFRSASRALKACSRISLLRADAWQIFECEQLMPWTCRGFRNFRSQDSYEHFQPRGRRSITGFLDRHKTKFGVLAFGGVIVWFQSREEIPYSHRKHAILLSAASERALGEHIYQQVKADALHKNTLLPAIHPAVQLVQRVGTRIVEQTTRDINRGATSHMEGLKWEFNVIQDDQVNAFVVPGGKVVVFTGLLRQMDDEDQLATVLAHEVGHVLGRHVAEKMTRVGIIQIFWLILALSTGLALPTDIINTVVFAHNSRALETEADKIGLMLAARACYKPAAFIPVMTRLGEEDRKSGLRSPEFLRTHPMSDTRIQQLRKELPKAEQMYQQAGCQVPRSFLADFR